MRIVFMGTPQYSVPTLARLFASGHTIEAVFSQPDKPVGRKQVITAPPVKTFALEHGIPVFQPNTLRNGEAFEILNRINPDLIVVVAYGKILPSDILNIPKYGCINGHASLLPKLRGASPVQWAIVTGETETGVTVMQMDEGMDTGDILSSVRIVIEPEDTADSLFSKLSYLTADLIKKTVSDIERGNTHPEKQDNESATYAPIIKKEMAHIDFSKSSDSVVNAVRGYYPWPVAFCFAGDKRIKVIAARSVDACPGAFGEVLSNKEKFIVSCGESTAVEFITVQPEGGKVMSAADMLRGNPIEIGAVLH